MSLGNIFILSMLLCCRYTGATALRGAAVFDPGTGRIWVGRPLCTLNDTTFSNCSFGVTIGGNTRCSHNSDAGVICYTQFGRYYNNAEWPHQGRRQDFHRRVCSWARALCACKIFQNHANFMTMPTN